MSAHVNRPRRATVIAVVFGVVGINFAVPVEASVNPIWSVDTAGRLVLGALLICAGGALALRPDEIRRGTEPASVRLLLLIGVTVSLFVGRLLISQVV